MRKNLFLIIFFLLSLAIYPQGYPDSNTDGKHYNVNGAKIWTVKFGKGDPLFLISGGPGISHYYMRSFDSLSAGNELIYFDALGRGKSDTATALNEYSLKRDIEDLEGLRKAMGYKKINILGHSYGGLVAQGYALQYPENVSHLILANTFHSYLSWQENCDNSNREMKTGFPELWDELMKLRDKGFVSSDQEHQEIYGQLPSGYLYAYNPDNFLNRNGSYPNNMNLRLYYQMVGRDGDFLVTSDIGEFDYRKELKNLKMPVLIYGGRYDRVAVPWMMIKYKEYCPQAEFIMFEKSGHQPQVEEPEMTFNAIRKFLSR